MRGKLFILAGLACLAPTLARGVGPDSLYTFPGGTDTQVQFNDTDSFEGSRGLSYDKTSFALKVGTNTATKNIIVEDSDGDLWILSNASYTASTNRFTRINVNKAAWGLELQGAGLFPGEVDSGWVVWRATAAVYGTRAISPTFGAVGGWELGFDVTSNRDLVVGGGSLEMDGFGSFPYGRLLHSTLSGTAKTGVGRNIYNAFSAHDSNSYPDLFVGFSSDTFVVQHGTAQATPNLRNLMVVSTGIPPVVNLGGMAINKIYWPDGTIQVSSGTGGGGGGSGDAVLAATQTWSGRNTYTSTQSVRIVPNGGSGSTAGLSGALFVDGTNAHDGIVAQIYRNDVPAQSQASALLFLSNDATSYNTNMLWIKSNSTSTIGGNADINIHANNPDIEFRELDRYGAGTGIGQWEIAVNNDELQMNQRNATDTSFQNLVGIARDGSMRFKELDGNGDYVGLIATQTLAGASFIYKLPSTDPVDGDVLHTKAYSNGYYDMYWAADSGGTVSVSTLTAGATNFIFNQNVLQQATWYALLGTLQNSAGALSNGLLTTKLNGNGASWWMENTAAASTNNYLDWEWILAGGAGLGELFGQMKVTSTNVGLGASEAQLDISLKHAGSTTNVMTLRGSDLSATLSSATISSLNVSTLTVLTTLNFNSVGNINFQNNTRANFTQGSSLNTASGSTATFTGFVAIATYTPNLPVKAMAFIGANSTNTVGMIIRQFNQNDAKDALQIQNVFSVIKATVDANGGALFQSLKTPTFNSSSDGNTITEVVGIQAPQTTFRVRPAAGNSGPLQTWTDEIGTTINASVDQYYHVFGRAGTTNPPLKSMLGGGVYDHYATVTANAGGDVDLYLDETPDNLFSADGDKVLIEYAGQASISVGPSLDIKFLYDGNSVFTHTYAVVGTPMFWNLKITLVRSGSSTLRYTTVFTTSQPATDPAVTAYGELTSLSFTGGHKYFQLVGNTSTPSFDSVDATMGVIQWIPAVY